MPMQRYFSTCANSVILQNEIKQFRFTQGLLSESTKHLMQKLIYKIIQYFLLRFVKWNEQILGNYRIVSIPQPAFLKISDSSSSMRMRCCMQH